jgi:hypothetical protein
MVLWQHICKTVTKTCYSASARSHRAESSNSPSNLHLSEFDTLRCHWHAHARITLHSPPLKRSWLVRRQQMHAHPAFVHIPSAKDKQTNTAGFVPSAPAQPFSPQEREARGAVPPSRSRAISAAAGDAVELSALLCDSSAASLMFSTPPSGCAAPSCSSLQCQRRSEPCGAAASGCLRAAAGRIGHWSSPQARLAPARLV